MNSDLQNKLFGTMQQDMVQPPAFKPEITVGGSFSLLDQMDRAFMPDLMSRHAMKAHQLMASIVDDDAVVIDAFVTNCSRLTMVQGVNQRDQDSVTLAVASAAIMMAAKQGSQTALEKLEGAMDILSERYQADW